MCSKGEYFEKELSGAATWPNNEDTGLVVCIIHWSTHVELAFRLIIQPPVNRDTKRQYIGS